MDKEHLTNFKVENFKRFDSLELTDIGQFNLIVGDNNVGKTSLLEALSVLCPNQNNNPQQSRLNAQLGFVLFRRNIKFDKDSDLFFKYLSKDDSKPIEFTYNINYKYYNALFEKKKDSTGGEIELKVIWNNEKIQFGVQVQHSLYNSGFIPANFEINSTLHKEYYEAIERSKKNKRLILENLTVIDAHITEIEVLPILEQQHVMIGFDNNDLFMPITGMGESAVRVFYYLLHILKNRGSFLLIDEIDSGIHYSRMTQFLKKIVQLAVSNEVQLFFTTHSLECQQAFAEIFEDPDMIQYQSDVRQYTLIEDTQGKVVANLHNFEQLQYALEIGFDTRGGKRGW